MIDESHERVRRPAGDGFTDAVTFSFGDPAAGLYGLARLGLSPGGGSALAVLFEGREPVGIVAEGGVPVPAGTDWERVELPRLRATVDEPLARWSVAMEPGVDLRFEALTAPAELDAGDPAARAGGMEGYEQLCRVTGSVRGRTVDCLGQRGHAWGAADWSRIDLARSLAAWLEDGSGIALTAIRPARAESHADEATWAALLEPSAPVAVAEPRLSTTYDADGRQRRAGLELWVNEEDDYPHRGAGQVLCGSSLELGELRLDCAFFAWHVDGRDGVGRYDVLRRA